MMINIAMSTNRSQDRKSEAQKLTNIGSPLGPRHHDPQPQLESTHQGHSDMISGSLDERRMLNNSIKLIALDDNFKVSILEISSLEVDDQNTLDLAFHP